MDREQLMQILPHRDGMLLLDSAVNLVDVAGLCGFDDQSYFTKVFKKATGISPKKYRDTRGQTG